MDGTVRDVEQLLDRLRTAGLRRGSLVALSLAGGVGLGLAAGGINVSMATPDPTAVVARVEAELRPRWVWWSSETPDALVAGGVRPATCWDIAAVHRVLFGGWLADPAIAWAGLNDLSPDSIPGVGQLDLLAAGSGATDADGGDAEDPVRRDSYLRPEWTSGGWARTPSRLARWASTALVAAELQRRRLDDLPIGGQAEATAHSESAAELLCSELAFDGLPIDRARAEQIVTTIVGPRSRDAKQASEQRARRDAAVLGLVRGGDEVDLRNPAQVRAMLTGVGIDVPDTRSWRLEPFVGAHPVVEALLGWRKAERIATTYGYAWLDEHVAADGRLRGAWTGSDGAAGRMTAQAGLHNLAAELRPAVAAEPGHVFVRADLGQIEPRVLAAVSGDAALARASAADDLYAPVAEQLGVDRPVAKVAVLAAMYGQTSGSAGEALRGLESAYPVSMRYLRAAYEAGRAGRDVRTHGGRLVRMSPIAAGLDEVRQRSALAARGRYARNAVVQGAAAEFFKTWAVTVRARAAALDAHIVLCLHDELLVQARVENAEPVVDLLRRCLDETAQRSPAYRPVHFVADISVVERWSDAKSAILSSSPTPG